MLCVSRENVRKVLCVTVARIYEQVQSSSRRRLLHEYIRGVDIVAHVVVFTPIVSQLTADALSATLPLKLYPSGADYVSRKVPVSDFLQGCMLLRTVCRDKVMIHFSIGYSKLDASACVWCLPANGELLRNCTRLLAETKLPYHGMLAHIEYVHAHLSLIHI